MIVTRVRGPNGPVSGDVAVFRFVDAFAGIGGMRGGLEMAGGRCVYTIENDPYACRTYTANWSPIQPKDIREVDPDELPPYDVLAAGFPCQPFSLAGVVKKESMVRESFRRRNLVPEAEAVHRAHGFTDPVSGNLFFEIIRLIDGPWELSRLDVEREASESESYDLVMQDEGKRRVGDNGRHPRMPPVLLLENVRNLAAHDSGRTLRVIRRRLMRSGYWVSHRVVNAAHWVPQRRERIFIVALRMDLFSKPFDFPAAPSEIQTLPSGFGSGDRDALRQHALSAGTWKALERHKRRHELSHNGFGYGVAQAGRPTRTLSARYYKDGAEILVPLPEDLAKDCGVPYRRLTHRECASLMGFEPPHMKHEFIFPEDMNRQLYRQFGNAVVIPQVKWLAEHIVADAKPVLEKRMLADVAAVR